MRKLLACLLVGVALWACGGEEPSGEPAVAAEAAPDFSLDLGEGGTFTLSEETRPVFMVFWAEW